MSTTTPTGDAVNGDGPGLPDEAVLTRLANQFFGALNSPETRSVPAPGGPTPPSAPPQPPSQLPQYEAPGQLSDYHRAAAVPGRMAALVAQHSSFAVPGLPPATAAAIRSGANPAPWELPSERRDGGLPGAPSFYFIDDGDAVPGRLGAAGVPATGVPADPAFHVEAVRRDFPVLQERVHGRQLVWLDNAATTQKPQVVIDRLVYFYQHENSNIHRGAHALAARATDAFEGARATVARFLGAPSADDIVFARGTTEAINLVAQAWGRKHIGPGDEIVVSHLEHHANIVPWQQLAEVTGAKIRVIPVDDDGQLLLDAYTNLLNDRTRLVSVAHVSNVLGTVVPVKAVIEAAHRAGARALIDGAQAVAHIPVDVQALDADFYVFSGHKIFGPTGIGALYAKTEILEEMPPWQGGGNMISDVTFERTIYQGPPAKFEAGTGNIADAVALGTALEYLQALGLPVVERYEHQLLEYALGEDPYRPRPAPDRHGAGEGERAQFRARRLPT